MGVRLSETTTGRETLGAADVVYKPNDLIAGSEFEHKINVFRPDRMSGWVHYVPQPGMKRTLVVRIDGADCAALDCDLFRGELDAGRFPTRDLGFRGHVPFDAWDGREHYVSLHLPDGTMVHGATLDFPDARLARAGFHGVIEPPRHGFLSGWVAHATGPVRVRAILDGRVVGSVLADMDAQTGKQFPYGFELMLPAVSFDGGAHELALFAETASGPVLLWQEKRMLAPADAPRLEGSGPILDAGGVRGTVKLAGDPVRALDLVLRVNGRARVRVRTEPATGSFVFPVTSIGELCLSDRLEVLVEGFDATLDGAPDDMLVRALSVTADPVRDALVLNAPFALVWPGGARLSGPEFAEPVSIDLGDTRSPRAQIVATLGSAPHGATEIELDGVRVPVSPSFAFRTRLQGIGTVRDPEDARVKTARIAVLEGGEDPEGDPSRPDVAGAWCVDASGILCGWALDLVQPGRPLDIAVFAGTEEISKQTADRPLLHPVAGMPALGVAAGFRVELSDRVADLPGPISVYPVGPDGPAATALTERTGASSDENAPLVALLERYRPEIAQYDRARLRNPIAPEVHALLRCALEARRPGRDAENSVARLGPALMASMVVFVDETLPALADPHVPLPHHRRVAAPYTMDLAPLLAALPIRFETRVACEASMTWRGWLEALVADPLLGDFLIPADPRQAYAIQSFHRGRAARGVPSTAPVAAAVPGAEMRVFFDSAGAMLWRGEASGSGDSTPYDDAPNGAVCSVDLYRDAWTIAPIAAGTVPAAAVEFDPDFEVSRVHVEGHVCEVDFCVPQDLRGWPDDAAASKGKNRTAWITLGARRIEGAITAQGMRLDLAQAAESGETGFDLRLDYPAGPRPVGVPDRVRPESGSVEVRNVLFSVNRLQVEVVTSGLANDECLVLRIEDEPETETEFVLEPGERSSSARPGTAEIALPSHLLDGGNRALGIVRRRPQGETLLWSGAYAADGDAVLGQWQRLPGARSRKAALAALAEAGRADVIEAIFAAPQADGAEVLAPRDAIEILVSLRTRLSPDVLPEALEAAFDALWAEALSRSRSGTDLAFASIRGIGQTQSASVRQRFPHSPLAESRCDFLVSAASTSDEDVAFALSEAISNRRFPIACALSEINSASDDPALLVQRSRLAHALGAADEAEALARRALAGKPGMRPAIEALARSFAAQGRHIEAAAAISDGKGLSAWCEAPPSYTHLKLFAALDWAGLTREILKADRPSLIGFADRGDAAGGEPLDIAADGFSLFYARRGPDDRAACFETLRPVGCAQIVTPAPHLVPEMECIGGWALVLDEPLDLAASLVRSIFSQARGEDAVLRLWRCPVDADGAPEDPEPVGVAIRRDMLMAFGALTPSDFVIAANRVLRVKSILI